MVRMTKKTLQCPQTLSLLRMGSGNETRARKEEVSKAVQSDLR